MKNQLILTWSLLKQIKYQVFMNILLFLISISAIYVYKQYYVYKEKSEYCNSILDQTLFGVAVEDDI